MEDINVLTHRLVSESTAPEKNIHAVELGKLGASKGGVERAKKLSKKRKKAIARKGGKARAKSLRSTSKK
jgi:hypothetical protein